METPLDPWKIATRFGIRVEYEYLPPGQHGEADGRKLVVLDPRLTAVQERVALYHEIVHNMYGHQGHQERHIEHHVRTTVARDLLPIHYILEHYDDHLTPKQFATRLGVTLPVLLDRRCATTPHEFRIFNEHRRRKHCARAL